MRIRVVDKGASAESDPPGDRYLPVAAQESAGRTVAPAAKRPARPYSPPPPPPALSTPGPGMPGAVVPDVSPGRSVIRRDPRARRKCESRHNSLGPWPRPLSVEIHRGTRCQCRGRETRVTRPRAGETAWGNWWRAAALGPWFSLRGERLTEYGLADAVANWRLRAQWTRADERLRTNWNWSTRRLFIAGIQAVEWSRLTRPPRTNPVASEQYVPAYPCAVESAAASGGAVEIELSSGLRRIYSSTQSRDWLKFYYWRLT